ncbi:MAG: SpoIIE family protein phosphatase, partial [Bacteroidota bacterium]
FLFGTALMIGGVNFADMMFLKALSNDQCGWLMRQDRGPGVLITDVVAGGVTDRAGVRNGDILLRIDGKGLDGPLQAMAILNAIPLGEYATYLIERDGEQFEARVQILKTFNITYLGYALLGFGFLIVGFVVVMTRPQGEVQRMFAWYSLSAMLVFSLSSLQINPEVDPGWKSILLIGGFVAARSLAMPMLILFFLRFPVRRRVLDRKWIIGLLYVVSVAMVLPFITNTLFRLPEWVAWFVVRAPLLFAIAGLLLFGVTYFVSVDGKARKHLRPILIGVAIGVLAYVYVAVVTATNQFVLFTNPTLLVPALLIAIIPVSFGYAIFRYRLMDIDLVIKRSLLYGAVTATVAAIYLVFVLGVGSLLGDLLGQSDNRVMNVVALLVIAFAFDPIKRKMQEGIDRVFYQERYNYQKALLEFSQQLPRQMNLDQILRSMVDTISGTMHVDRVAIVLCDEPEGCYVQGKGVPAECCTFGTETGGLLDLLRHVRTSVTFGLLAVEPDSLNIHDADKRKILDSGIVLAIPMFLQDRLIGTINVGPKRSGRMYSREDIDLLATVGSQAAVAIENARLHRSEIDRQKFREELSIARRIQEGLLPKENPDIEGLDVSGISLPATTVGGDYFDYIEPAPGKLLVVVADVSGKGMPAALYMSKVQGMVQLAAHMYETPKDILINVNRRIFDGIERKSFITMIAALFDLNKREVRICRAGHNKALIGIDGAIEYLETEGIGLGLERGPIFENTLKEIVKPLEPGSIFFFYTDGLTETMNDRKIQLGEETIHELLSQKRHLTATEVQRSVLTAVEEFRGNAEPHDDLTLVVVKVG